MIDSEIPFHTFVMLSFICFRLKEVGLFCWQHREHLPSPVTEFHVGGDSSLLPPEESLLDVQGSNRGHRRADSSMGWRRHKTLAAARFSSPFSSHSPSVPLLFSPSPSALDTRQLGSSLKARNPPLDSIKARVRRRQSCPKA